MAYLDAVEDSALIRYQAYGELGTHLDETSNLDYSVADEEFLMKHNA
jgi:hypothetical protein